MIGTTSHSRGFTLLEVLVALAVLAIALAAMVKGGSENSRNAAHLRDKTFAHWVAMNRMAELQLEGSWPDKGSNSGSVEMAHREWFWSITVKETPDPALRRVDIEVRGEDDRDAASLARLEAYLGQHSGGRSQLPSASSGGVGN